MNKENNKQKKEEIITKMLNLKKQIPQKIETLEKDKRGLNRIKDMGEKLEKKYYKAWCHTRQEHGKCYYILSDSRLEIGKDIDKVKDSIELLDALTELIDETILETYNPEWLEKLCETLEYNLDLGPINFTLYHQRIQRDKIDKIINELAHMTM